MEQESIPSQATLQLSTNLGATITFKMIHVMIMVMSLRKGNHNNTTLKLNVTWLKVLLTIF